MQRNIQELEREYNQESRDAERSSEELLRRWKEVLQPETDYESDGEFLSDSESEPSTCSSDSSFLSDSSDFSTDEEHKTTGDDCVKKPPRKKGSKKVKV